MRRGPTLALGLLLLGCSSEAPVFSGGTTTTTTSASGGSGGAGGAGQGGGGGEGGSAVTITDPKVVLPRISIEAGELAVIVNEKDPQSVEVGAYYQQARGIPDEHVVKVSFTVAPVMTFEEFLPIYSQVTAALGDEVQALALTWPQPHRVECMSVTSAFAFGFDSKWCNQSGMSCGKTASSPYFDSPSTRPYTDLGVRPTMALAALDSATAKALIDRGVAADGTFPSGRGWMIRTTDVPRSVRWPDFVATAADWNQLPPSLELGYVDNSAGNGDDFITGESDVLFYFTGLATVPAIDTLAYRPGAIADHLTSFGGKIPSGGQMSVVEWIAAGVTGSYGTTVEPCNYTQKFPNPRRLLPRYFRGATLIEAYYQSVRWPGEGLFVGEPLARPWGVKTAGVVDGKLVIRTTSLVPGVVYQLGAAATEEGPFEVVVDDIVLGHHELTEIAVEPPFQAVYKLAEAGSL